MASISDVKTTWLDVKLRLCGSQKYAVLSTFVIIFAVWNCHDEDECQCATCGESNVMNRVLVLIHHLLYMLGIVDAREMFVNV